jgi:hypothetical protein
MEPNRASLVGAFTAAFVCVAGWWGCNGGHATSPSPSPEPDAGTVDDAGSQPPTTIDVGAPPEDDAEAGSSCVGKSAGVGGCTDVSDASTAYSCLSGDLPPSKPSTTCAYLGMDPPGVLYCCSPGACTPGASFSGCASPGVLPYECADAATPDQADPSIWCMAGGAAPDGMQQYCCFPSKCDYAGGAGFSACSLGDTVVSCTGSATPRQLDPTLTCVVQPGGTTPSTTYCCRGG